MYTSFFFFHFEDCFTRTSRWCVTSSRPKRLLSLQVRPVRPDPRGAPLPVEARRGEQGHPGEGQEGAADAAQGDHQADTQPGVVVHSEGQLLTRHLGTSKKNKKGKKKSKKGEERMKETSK